LENHLLSINIGHKIIVNKYCEGKMKKIPKLGVKRIKINTKDQLNKLIFK